MGGQPRFTTLLILGGSTSGAVSLGSTGRDLHAPHWPLPEAIGCPGQGPALKTQVCAERVLSVAHSKPLGRELGKHKNQDGLETDTAGNSLFP